MSNPIYMVTVDEIPYLTTNPHEICEPDELSSEEIVKAWDILRAEYIVKSCLYKYL